MTPLVASLFRKCSIRALSQSKQWVVSESIVRRITFGSSEPPGVSLADLKKIRILREQGIAPATGQPLSEIAAEVWDHVTNPAGPGHRTGRKVLEKPLKGPLYASWYPESPAKNPYNPFKLTPKQERWKEKLKILRAAGKGPPKKGSGKRSK